MYGAREQEPGSYQNLSLVMMEDGEEFLLLLNGENDGAIDIHNHKMKF